VLPDTFPRPRCTVLFAVLTGLVVLAVSWSTIPSTSNGPGQDGTALTQSSSGPVGPRDRDFLIALRQSTLWQIPVSQQAEQVADDPAVRTVAAAMAADLGPLAAQVRARAGALGVALPSQPTSTQQGWLSEISGESGSGYDHAVVKRLRDACAATLTQARQLGAATRNEQMRSLADQTGRVATRYLAALGGSGAVPDGSAEGATTLTSAGALAASSGSGPSVRLSTLMMIIAALSTIAGLVRLLRSRARTRHGITGFNGSVAVRSPSITRREH
jgi:predicted outer membrane protein